jgi:hypothetical protein
LDGLSRIEQRGLARAGAAATHVDAGRHRLVKHDRRDAGCELGVLGVADTNARDVGDEIAQRHAVDPITAVHDRAN